MKPNESAPERVNLLRRFLALMLFMTGYPCILVCMPWRRGEKAKARLEQAYDWLSATIIKINPNFDS